MSWLTGDLHETNASESNSDSVVDSVDESNNQLFVALFPVVVIDFAFEWVFVWQVTNVTHLQWMWKDDAIHGVPQNSHWDFLEELDTLLTVGRISTWKIINIIMHISSGSVSGDHCGHCKHLVQIEDIVQRNGNRICIYSKLFCLYPTHELIISHWSHFTIVYYGVLG